MQQPETILINGRKYIPQTELARVLGLTREAVDRIRRDHAVTSEVVRLEPLWPGQRRRVRIYGRFGALQLCAIARTSSAIDLAQQLLGEPEQVNRVRSLFQPVVVALTRQLRRHTQADRVVVVMPSASRN